MINYNSSILRHEANHYDELVKQFPDLTIQFEENSSYYYSDLIFPVANKVLFNNELMYNHGLGTHTAALIFELTNCNICNDFYKINKFVIHSHVPPIRICTMENTDHSNSKYPTHPLANPPYPLLEIMLSAYNYEDVFLELGVPTSIIKEVDLHIIKLIKENSIKHLRVNKRIHSLLTFM